MCEWNVQPDDDPDNDDSVVMFTRVRRILWRLTPWRHGPDCRWRKLWRFGEIVGATD